MNALGVLALLAFLGVCIAHVGIASTLLTRTPRWRGVVAFFVPALAPYWASQSGLTGWLRAWTIAVAAYAAIAAFALAR